MNANSMNWKLKANIFLEIPTRVHLTPPHTSGAPPGTVRRNTGPRTVFHRGEISIARCRFDERKDCATGNIGNTKVGVCKVGLA